VLDVLSNSVDISNIFSNVDSVVSSIVVFVMNNSSVFNNIVMNLSNSLNLSGVVSQVSNSSGVLVGNNLVFNVVCNVFLTVVSVVMSVVNLFLDMVSVISDNSVQSQLGDSVLSVESDDSLDVSSHGSNFLVNNLVSVSHVSNSVVSNSLLHSK
jgi:hypothetical protein